MITPEQCLAARQLLGWSRQQLADIAKSSPNTVRRCELGGHGANPATLRAIRQAFEAAGISFNADGGSEPVLRPESQARPAKRPRGFAMLSPERRREVAFMGGKAVPDEKRSFFRSPQLAAQAGRVGGHATSPEKRSFSNDRALAQDAGRRGGLTSARRKADNAKEPK
jgi:general stress protein YciG